MSDTEVLSIGEIARRSGLTAGALRFYADSGLLRPAQVDPSSGYRRYHPDQVPRAALLKQLRRLGMPLTTVAAVLDADPSEAAELVERHVADMVDTAALARQRASTIIEYLTGEQHIPVATVGGPMLAAAIEQVLGATTTDPRFAVLNAVLVESGPAGLEITATDRFRLAARTLVAETAPQRWVGVVDADDLRACLSDLRRSVRVHISATPHTVRFEVSDGDRRTTEGSDRAHRHCRLHSEPFPDHRLMMESLAAVTTRVVTAKAGLLRAIEAAGDPIELRVDADAVAVAGSRLPATVTGAPERLWFALTTLYPAVTSAIGTDLLIDLRGADQPATIRSADDGDLTTLAMPIRPDSPKGTP